MFIIPAGLAPGLMHVGVNIRTYSWTVFLVTACALTAYEILRRPKCQKLWLLLFLTTVTGLLCHHFTAFSYLFIYLYLFVKLDDIIVFFQYDNLIEINKIVSV